MAFTRHGHHITGSPIEGETNGETARCGGQSLCAVCSKDAWDYFKENPPKELVMQELSNQQTPILRYFSYTHLSHNLADVSKPFCELAEKLDLILPNGPEKSTALRKLLEGKDAAVRAALDI